MAEILLVALLLVSCFPVSAYICIWLLHIKVPALSPLNFTGAVRFVTRSTLCVFYVAVCVCVRVHACALVEGAQGEGKHR